MKLIKLIILVLFLLLSALPMQAKVQTLNVNSGKSFNIELKSNPTTGYQWQIKKIDKNFLELESSTFIPSLNKNTNIVGSGGIEIWSFKALKTGQTSVSFVYSRSWEHKKPIQKNTFIINIKN